MADNEKISKRQGANVILFLPEHWGEVDKFSRFWSTTYSFDMHSQKKISGVIGHLSKVNYLTSLARRLSPNLAEDERQLHENGHSPAHNAKELAAVIETIFCELYSVLDCARGVLYSIFPNHKGIRQSTRGTFQNAFADEIDDEIPGSICEALKQTESWFHKLRKLRDEVTHQSVGSCTRNRETDKISYLHTGLGGPGKSLVIENVFSEIECYFKDINNFLSSVFRELNDTLKDKPVRLLCVVSDGRFFMRKVCPSEAKDFDSGFCESQKFFDAEGGIECPYKHTCQAYARAKSEMGS